MKQTVHYLTVSVLKKSGLIQFIAFKGGGNKMNNMADIIQINEREYLKNIKQH